MRILSPMTYYRPYVSGPIVYAETIAAKLIESGSHVTFVSSRHDLGSSESEVVNGVDVVRCPVALRASKGVVAPSFLPTVWKLLQAHDLLWVQWPQLEAPLLAWIAKLQGKPCVMTHHCDVRLPPGWLNQTIESAMELAAVEAADSVDRIVAYTDEYAQWSRTLSAFRQKVEVISPPVSISPVASADVARFRQKHGLVGKRAIGICGRMSTEKGIEVLLSALTEIRKSFPDVVAIHAGPDEVFGEGDYVARVRALAAPAGDAWRPLGVLGRDELPAFYGACHVLALPSVISMESFGLVQVEAMICGTPVVASELPGVDVPTKRTGMGLRVPAGDPRALARTLVEVLARPEHYTRPRSEVEKQFSLEQTTDSYLKLFRSLASASTHLM